MYDKSIELQELSFQKWAANEVFSFGWFICLLILIIFYAVWLKLFDKKRATQLLLIGSLAAVAYEVNSMILGTVLGLVEYTTRLAPVPVQILISSLTLSPIIIMLVQQYTSSWKSYILWSSIGFSFLNFVIFNIFEVIGVLKFHNWNVLYHFVVLEVISLIVRVVFIWIDRTQKRSLQSNLKTL